MSANRIRGPVNFNFILNFILISFSVLRKRLILTEYMIDDFGIDYFYFYFYILFLIHCYFIFIFNLIFIFILFLCPKIRQYERIGIE